MSKYSEMCEAAGVARKNGLEFRERCWHNLHLLIEGFKADCEFPGGQCEIVPLDKPVTAGAVTNVVGAAHFDPKDGYWHVGLVITLKVPNQSPQRLLIRIALTERAGKVLVKTGTNDKPREIDLGNAGQLKAFYDEIVDDIKKYFTAEPDFDDKPSLKKVGFEAA
jgi:hypothetical protein